MVRHVVFTFVVARAWTTDVHPLIRVAGVRHPTVRLLATESGLRRLVFVVLRAELLDGGQAAALGLAELVLLFVRHSVTVRALGLADLEARELAACVGAVGQGATQRGLAESNMLTNNNPTPTPNQCLRPGHRKVVGQRGTNGVS